MPGIPVSQIDPGPNDRKRFSQDKMQRLADSIEREGLAEPIW